MKKIKSGNVQVLLTTGRAPSVKFKAGMDFRICLNP